MTPPQRTTHTLNNTPPGSNISKHENVVTGGACYLVWFTVHTIVYIYRNMDVARHEIMRGAGGGGG